MRYKKTAGTPQLPAVFYNSPLQYPCCAGILHGWHLHGNSLREAGAQAISLLRRNITLGSKRLAAFVQENHVKD